MNLEDNILASFLCDQDAIHQCLKLSEDDFTAERKEIFKTIVLLYKENLPVEPLTVSERIPKFSDYIFALFNNYLSSVYVESHVRQLRDNTTRRKLKNILDQCIRKLDDKNIKVNDILTELIKNVSINELDSNIESQKNLVKKFIIEFEKKSKEQYTDIIKAGFNKLDEIVYIKPFKLIILAARPSAGKTAFAINLAMNFAKNNLNVLFYSLEMDEGEILERQIAKESRVNYNHIQDPKRLSTVSLVDITKNLKKVMDLPIIYEREKNINIIDICIECRRLRAQNKIDIIIIDYLQLVRSSLKFGSTNDKIAEISRELKLLAGELKIPIFVLSQLNRDIEKRQDPTPRLSDLRDSGAIEQDADIVIFLHRENKESRDRKVIIEKNRGGNLGEFNINFLGEFQEFI